MLIISANARGIPSRLPERCVPQQARLHARLTSVRRRTNPCARAHVKVYVHKRACTAQEVARTVPQEHATLRQSDVRRTSCISSAHIGSHGARASHDTCTCSCLLAGGDFCTQEARWCVSRASFTASDCERTRPIRNANALLPRFSTPVDAYV